MFGKMSLSVRISLIFSLVVALLLGVVTLVIGMRLSTAIEKLIEDENLQIAKARAAEIGELLDKLHSQLGLVAASPQLATTDKAKLASALGDYAKLTAAEGGALIYVYPDGSYFTTLGGSGDVSDRDYYAQVIKGGVDYYIADEDISKSLGVPIVVLAQGVNGAKGVKAGMVAFQMKAEVLSQIVAGVKIGTTGYAYIADSRGLIIAHPNKDIILNLNLLDSAKSGWSGLDAVGKDMQAGIMSSKQYKKPDGTQVVGFYAPIPNSRGWDLALAVPLAEIDQTRNSLLALLYAVLAIGVVIAIVAALLLARSIVRPVRLVVDTMKAVAEGDLLLAGIDATARDSLVARGDELGTLGKSIRDMRGSLDSIAKEIRGASNQVHTGSEQMSEMAQGLAQGANEQAASIEESRPRSRSSPPRSSRTPTTRPRPTPYRGESRRTPRSRAGP